MQSESYGSELVYRMLIVNEVAHLLYVHPSTVRRWEKQDQLKSYRLGPKGVIRFKREDVSNFIDPANKSQDGDGYGNFAKVALKGANSERYTG